MNVKRRAQKYRRRVYILNGALVTLSSAAIYLGYTHYPSLRKRVHAEKIPPGGDISGLINHYPGRTCAKKFIVNGELMNISAAAAALGYVGGSAGLSVKIKKLGIAAGSDISNLIARGGEKLFVVNGKTVNLTSAARALGRSASNLSTLLKKNEIKTGDDISHLSKK